MKKHIFIVLLLVCAMSLTACSQQNSADTSQNNVETSSSDIQTESQLDSVVILDEIREFSFDEDRATYREGDPGVYTDGFENTTETEITSENVAEHAKRECTIKYDTISIEYDPVECVWAVNFFNDGWAGGGETVYMDSDGKTLLIVYGE